MRAFRVLRKSGKLGETQNRPTLPSHLAPRNLENALVLAAWIETFIRLQWAYIPSNRPRRACLIET